MIALANLKQTGTVFEIFFIKLAHLVDDSESKLISLFLFGLREDLRGKVNLDKLASMVVTYRSAYVREMIALTERRLAKFRPYKGFNSSTLLSPSPVKALAASATGKEGSPGVKTTMRRLTLAQLEEYKRKNLCFKCDVPYIFGHKCKGKSLVLTVNVRIKENAEVGEEEILLEAKGKK